MSENKRTYELPELNSVTIDPSSFIEVDNELWAEAKCLNLEGANGIATLDMFGKLKSSQTNDLSITDIITAIENNLADFAVNSGDYTFEKGDIIEIIDLESVLFQYIYKGGDKTDVNNYSLVNASKISWANVLNIPFTLQATIEDDSTVINDEIVTPFRFWQGIAKFLSRVGNSFVELINFQKGIEIKKGFYIYHRATSGTDTDGDIRIYDSLSGLKEEKRVAGYWVSISSRRIEYSLIGQFRLPATISAVDAEKITIINSVKNIYTLKLINNNDLTEIIIRNSGVNQSLPINVPIADYDFTVIYETGKSDGKIILTTELQ